MRAFSKYIGHCAHKPPAWPARPVEQSMPSNITTVPWRLLSVRETVKTCGTNESLHHVYARYLNQVPNAMFDELCRSTRCEVQHEAPARSASAITRNVQRSHFNQKARLYTLIAAPATSVLQSIKGEKQQSYVH